MKIGNPSMIKKIVEIISKNIKKFSLYEQQDSIEFIDEFLSLLNEDLNECDKKFFEKFEEKMKDESEFEYARRFWNYHLQRNDSIITDLFTGLMKSNTICSKCSFDNISFKPFNILTLEIPSYKYIQKKLYTNFNTCLFYIPKYSFGFNYRIIINMPKYTKYKDIAKEINNVKNFPYKLDKLTFIKIDNSQFQKIMDPDEKKEDKNELIFAFDDQRKDKKTKIIPLYMYKHKNLSSFPRFLFLKDNTTFGDLKRQIYYFARKFMKNPLKGFDDNNNNLDEKINQLNTSNKIEEKQLNELFSLIDKEYNIIFGDKNNKKNFEKLFKDFPYIITLKKKFDDKEQLLLFNGENNFEVLKKFKITKDEDPITSLINNKDYCLNLILIPKNEFSVSDINLDRCEVLKGDYIDSRKGAITLDYLLDYFYETNNILKEGNEFQCRNCKNAGNLSKNSSIYYAPKILIIHLKPFIDFSSDYKNNILIQYPKDNLDLGKYITGPDKEYSKYDLFAVNQYYEGKGEGFYIATCKNIDGNWYNYNDSSISKISDLNKGDKATYILFYRRKTW